MKVVRRGVVGKKNLTEVESCYLARDKVMFKVIERGCDIFTHSRIQ